MARAINYRAAQSLVTFKAPAAPGREVDDQIYFAQPKGINTLARLSQIPNEFASDITNLMLNEGFLRSRFGIESMGSPDDRVQAILSFTPASGGGVLVRLRVDGADTWNGSSWTPVIDIILTGHETDRFTWTGWGDALLICNGADKIISYNVLSGEVKILEESSPARHITSFNGRVVASAVTDGAFKGHRVRWSVKLNDEDWTAETTTDAIGAGYEDLLASPGGRVDEVMGVFPLSDESAIMVREQSLWTVLVTGNVDAPFRFSRLTGEIGTRARHACAISPFGIIVVSMEDIFIVDQSGPKSIGSGVRRTMLPAITDFPALTGSYDPRRQEYRLAVQDNVWRYNFRDQGWTRDRYLFMVKHLSFVDYKSIGLTMDALGTIDDFGLPIAPPQTMDELTGTFDELGIIAAREATHFVRDSDGEVLRENATISNDNTVDSPFEIVTGLLAAATPLEKTEIIEAQLEYECEEDQRVFFDYSTNKGGTWIQYSYVDLSPTAGPRITAVRKTLEHHNLQIKARSEKLGKLSLISLHLFVVKGAKVNY